MAGLPFSLAPVAYPWADLVLLVSLSRGSGIWGLAGRRGWLSTYLGSISDPDITANKKNTLKLGRHSGILMTDVPKIRRYLNH